MYILVGDDDDGGGCACVVKRVYEKSVPPQFHCKPKTVLKIKMLKNYGKMCWENRV